MNFRNKKLRVKFAAANHADKRDAGLVKLNKICLALLLIFYTSTYFNHTEARLQGKAHYTDTTVLPIWQCLTQYSIKGMAPQDLVSFDIDLT
jgi:hypothetical protein